MKQITKIKPQKNKKRVNIFLDGAFAFGLDMEVYMKSGIKVEDELSEVRIKELVEESNYKDTLNKLLKYATTRPRSEQEIRRWLDKHSVHESLYEKLVGKLKKLELYGDEKFAMWWVKQRLEFKHRSKRQLYSELMKKGVDKPVIKKVISGLVDQDYEENKAKELLEKKLYKWKKFSGYEKRQKMSAYLARKGFNWSDIKKVVEEILGEK